jgi:alkanesulfonate monooxygenase SsuD/methylene tetrahydromethanopterin reductase-like flavin-dependent oxidoreductase (luciferase family)
MEFIANFMTVDIDPMDWATEREAEGWQVLGCADHFWSGARTYPHVWVTLTAMAAATSQVKLTTSFANNLFRSPVEFAQAAFTLQAVSKGRFEAGLGAGWSKDECTGSALTYPDPGERASRLIEAVQIVRQLFDTGSAKFSGRYYDIDVPQLGGTKPPYGAPELVASVGGDRTIAGAAPWCDRVEIKLISSATKAGSLDLPKLAAIPRSHLNDLVDKIRAANATAPLSVFILCAAGEDPQTKAVEELLGDSFFGGFFGHPEKVAGSMHALAEAGLSRVQVSPFNADAFTNLAPYLFTR